MTALNERLAPKPSLFNIEFTNAIGVFGRTAYKTVGITSLLERIEILRFHGRRKSGRGDGERQR
ncbi:hypothetical protein D1006_39155 [Burkholderia stabilis]|uniref:Uncharacterized protein n=1 Tax=Burkholderia stabilis TaxID=95485 RepID=A0A4Q2A616_9BURK|nr:hypothetical protein [Burkholderia stabilis]RXV64395.1 hypothetical protein D1006_39155 [Burkholderia stabilis]